MARASIFTLIISIFGFIIAIIAYVLYWFRGVNIGDLEDFWNLIVFAGVYGEWIKWGLIIGIVGLVLTIFFAIIKI